jgi:AcrR family transcriptional regulator
MSTQKRGEETRSRILEAATTSFAQNGYDVTGVAEICRRANVTKGAFYHHFPSKQAVFLELLEQWLAGLDTQLQVASDGAATVPEKLLQMTAMIRPVFQMAGDQLPIFLEFWSKARHDPTIWQATVAPYRRYCAFFARLIETGIAEGSLRAVKPETAAQILVSLAVGLLLQGVLDPQGADWGQVTEKVIQMFLEGLLPDPA